MQPLVSVITRTKNRPVLLERAINSVLNQTLTNWQHIIINDGGDEAVMEAIADKYSQPYHNRLLVINNKVSTGMEAASNKALRRSEAKYIGIHDDDDTWHRDFLAETTAFLESKPTNSFRGVAVHTSRVVEQMQSNGSVRKISEERFNHWADFISLYRMAASNIFPPISFVYERQVLDDIGYYREDLPVLGDWDFHLRFLVQYEIGLIKKTLAYYHHRINLQSHGDVYSNTVVSSLDQHKLYDSMIRNDLLRKDIKTNSFGLGYLVNTASQFEIINGQFGPINKLLKALYESIILRALRKLKVISY